MKDFFQLRQRGSSVPQEIRGAAATYLTMAYILFVNPDILAKAGVPRESAVACTALAAGICSILMGAVANFPLAMASGMGLNAIVAFVITKAVVDHHIAAPEVAWKTAMGVIVIEGLITLALVVTGLREGVMNAIPRDLRLATGAGIGLFIAFIGLTNAKIVTPGFPIVAPGRVWIAGHPLREQETAVALVGLVITGCLLAWKVRGGLLIGMLATTGIALSIGMVSVHGITLHRPTFEAAFQADVRGALSWALVPLIFAVIMVDFFDTIGTATAVAEQGGLQDSTGRIPGIRRVLMIDSISASIGGLLGASSVTAYIESASGVAEGARTGLHSIVVGVLFLLSIFLAPFAGLVPEAATAPALILVGFLMISQFAGVDFADLETAIPAFVTLITIPLTYSIAHGIGYGFILYVAMKAARGKFGEVKPLMYATAAAFAAYFLWAPA